jgi:hypothetical protein
MAVAKAVVKKPAVVKAKATGKAVAKPAKKPVAKATKAAKAVAKKPVVKKPTGAKAAKFNFNKLIMLIIRDVPKKGKKMTGGYKKTDLQVNIFTPITKFITTHKQRIKNRITEILSNETLLKPTIGITVGDSIPDIFTETVNESDIEKIIKNIAEQADLHKTLDNTTLPNTIQPDAIGFDKHMYVINFMTIVIALCKVYNSFNTTVKP